MKYLLAANVKDEHNIQEWIHYHLLLGFSTILIWDDGSAQPIVFHDDRVIIMRGHDNKLGYMRKCVRYAVETDHDWIIHLDADEYLYLGKDVRLGDGFVLPNDAICVLFPWVMFGSNHITRLETKGSCLQPFQRCAFKTHSYVKSFARVDMIENVRSPHEYIYKQPQTSHNTKLAPNKPLHRFGPMHPREVCPVDENQCFIAHYRFQSWDLFCQRKGRQRDDTQEKWKFNFQLGPTPPPFFHRNSNNILFPHLINNYNDWMKRK